MDDDQEAELRNPFPSPPSHYTKYTAHNLRLLALLKSRTENEGGNERDQHEILSDEKDVPDWPLLQLEKPRVDWILEDGHYSVYGDTWFVKENVPSLGELGGQQLYPHDPTVDRRPALKAILRSLLVSYTDFLRSLLLPPPSPYDSEPPDWQRHAEWMTVMSQNIMSAANELRPVQARVNLELMMKRQLQLRREETASVHSTCDILEQRLSELREKSSQVVKDTVLGNSALPDSRSKSDAGVPVVQADPMVQPSVTDLLRWAEGS